MGKRLSEAEVARYGRDGFHYPVDVFGRDEARHYLGELQSFERRARARFREANREETLRYEEAS